MKRLKVSKPKDMYQILNSYACSSGQTEHEQKTITKGSEVDNILVEGILNFEVLELRQADDGVDVHDEEQEHADVEESRQ
ncbi:hypothetical protein MAR_024589 [Mya arenaria]|uniref:Uncharacterized protein n=1 Tax=Mya arenaria TaxID=6604 RepID=A0ABY7DR84_MYAAR|nr:hypothetical protein MAR_024589 [Mya arenaria]